MGKANLDDWVVTDLTLSDLQKMQEEGKIWIINKVPARILKMNEKTNQMEEVDALIPSWFWWFNKDGFIEECLCYMDGAIIYIKPKGIRDININNIKVFVDEKGEKKIYDKAKEKSYSLDEYLREKGITGRDKAHIMALLDRIKPQKAPFNLELYEDNGYLRLPEEISGSNNLTKWLKNALKINYIDLTTALNELEEALNLFTPEQRSDLVYFLGESVANILIQIRQLPYLKAYGYSFGVTNSGKTFVYQYALRFFYGINEYWKATALEGKGFRVDALMNLTNLPILIDDVDAIKKQIISLLKSSTGSGAKSFRGKANQEINIYGSKSVLFITSNNYLLHELDVANRLAIERRMYINQYSNPLPEEQKSKGAMLLENHKTRGFLYKYFEKKPVDELVEKYRELYIKCNGNDVATSYEFGKYLLRSFGIDIDKYELRWQTEEELTIDIYEKILTLVNRFEMQQEGKMDYEAMNLKSMIDIGKIGDDENKIDVVYITQPFIEKYLPKVESLNDLNGLNELFSKEILSKLPKGTIYDRDYVFRIKNRVVRCAIVPLQKEIKITEAPQKIIEKAEIKDDLPHRKTIIVLLKEIKEIKKEKPVYDFIMTKHINEFNEMVFKEEIDKVIDWLIQNGDLVLNPSNHSYVWKGE